jgi:hypothetical protein
VIKKIISSIGSKINKCNCYGGDKGGKRGEIVDDEIVIIL